MNKKRIKISDVAKKANVSISTVSHALNDSGYVKKETKEKIKKIADKFNYKSSIIATALRRRSLNLIAIVVGNVRSSFFSEILNGVNKIALKEKFHTVILNTNFNEDEEITLINNIKNQFADGIIFISGRDNDECIRNLAKEKFPFVLLMRKTKVEAPKILIDNYQAIIEVVNYLYKNGHHKIGYVSMPFDNWTTVRERYLGFKKGLKINRIDYNPDSVLIDETLLFNEINASYELCKTFFRKANLPTAIITATDNIAIGLYSALKETGIRIPDDVSIVGFDDLLISKHLDPPLTTIKQPTKQAGVEGTKMILDYIRNGLETNIEKKLDYKFIVRKSVKNNNY